MLKMVKMTKPKSCSVCCIAILTGKSFEEAVSLCFQRYPESFSMDFDAMENALIRSGLRTERLENTPETANKNLLIECRHKQEKYWHYIVYDAERSTFLDPIPNPPRVEEYQFLRAIVIMNEA